MSKYDAVIVGSGPNGLAAAITLQRSGLSVLLAEGKETIGGGMRTAELTLPGFQHDICSAIHPMGVGSPFFKSLPLHEHGLEYIHPEVMAAHPFDDGSAAALYRSPEETADGLGVDKRAYLRLFRPLLNIWPKIDSEMLGPLLKFPKHPIDLAKFGLKALLSGKQIASRYQGRDARGLWSGLVAHSMVPLEDLTSSAIGLILSTVGHIAGWPIPKGGSQSIANALASYFVSLGGEIQTGKMVGKLSDIPESKALLFDTSPSQLLEICGDRLSARYQRRLKTFKYGMGVFKVDWALSEPVPFLAEACRKAGTVHIGNTFEEVALSERQIWEGKHPERPYVLFAQQSLYDPTRAPKGLHTGWGYCHVPNGSQKDMTAIIEAQVERFAPGFRDTILARHTYNSAELHAYNPNYIGGDINGGVVNITQLINRPVLSFSPYKTSAKGIYICSASTPPGGGVHGMCGFYAAKQVLKDLF